MSEIFRQNQESLSLFIQEQDLVLERDLSSKSQKFDFNFAEEAPIQTPNASLHYETLNPAEIPVIYHEQSWKIRNLEPSLSTPKRCLKEFHEILSVDHPRANSYMTTSASTFVGDRQNTNDLHIGSEFGKMSILPTMEPIDEED